MTSSSGTYRLRQLTRRYKVMRVSEALCWSVAAAALAYSVLQLSGATTFVRLLVAFSVFTLSFGIQLLSRALHKINLATISRYLDFNYPQLENSTDLLRSDRSSLRGLQQLQYDRTAASLESDFPSIRFPNKLGSAAGVSAASLTLLILSIVWSNADSDQRGQKTSIKQSPGAIAVPLPPGIRSLEIIVDPPGYTGIRQRKETDPGISVPEGSRVSWQITFDQDIERSAILIGERDTLVLNRTGLVNNGSANFNATTLYRIIWVATNDSAMVSDYYAINVVADGPPLIETQDLKQFTEFRADQHPVVTVSASLSDDYGLTDSYLVATVARGSGESVKFREEALRFNTPSKVVGKKVRATRTLNLNQLGLEPGDELYFYLIAFDNRKPEKNFTRTETFFITIQDTTNVEAGFDGSLGVDLMPEYFRSQRQIIIDSEKLLKEKPTISKKEFQSRSNELAHDQKILRLRYGQFLGEEFETGMVHEESDHEHGEADHDHHDDEDDVTKKYGHVHDGENEHNLVPEHNHHHDNGHDDEEGKDPLAGFIHSHDDPEEATFFTQSIKAKLKATLSIMWDAELHLRLSDPAKSLAYQYKALKLLKEISNDSRIYVHRTGFDPPPIKEEKRLTGELDGVRGGLDRHDVSTEDEFAILRNASRIVEVMIHAEHRDFSESHKDILRKAGQKIASLAINAPGEYLETLSILQRITNENSSSSADVKDLRTLRKALNSLIPRRPEQITTQHRAAHRSDSLFVKNLFAP